LTGRDWDREARSRRQQAHGSERFNAERLDESWLGRMPRPDLESPDYIALEKAERRLGASYSKFRSVVTSEPGQRRQRSLLVLLLRLDRNRDLALGTITHMCVKRPASAHKLARELDHRIAWLRAAIREELGLDEKS
jgi:hypothetical protein